VPEIDVAAVLASIETALVGQADLDLDGNGIKTTTVQNGVTFDLNNDGVLEKSAWVARGDGLLVRDINGDGKINNGGELFGSGTVLANGSKAKDGYEAMRALDSNSDGVLNSADAAFSQLGVWLDANGNGIADAGEAGHEGELQGDDADGVLGVAIAMPAPPRNHA